MTGAIHSPEKVLAVIRVRLKEINLGMPHMAIAVTPKGETVLRNNVSADAPWSCGEYIADEEVTMAKQRSS